jgi:Peptidyl-prolyl cis-trans isomerase (rotamase) - cyclophilin family
MTTGLTAHMQTSAGMIQIELYDERAPQTVENFRTLAMGERSWTDPDTGEERTDPLYAGTVFHRVIADFMIQGGDPAGDGSGGPGFTFEDEFHPELRHDAAGVLSMANRGPDTNGSQFFITLAPQPHLDDRHAVFGRVVDGMEVVEAIGATETDAQDRPVEAVSIEAITVEG